MREVLNCRSYNTRLTNHTFLMFTRIMKRIGLRQTAAYKWALHPCPKSSAFTEVGDKQAAHFSRSTRSFGPLPHAARGSLLRNTARRKKKWNCHPQIWRFRKRKTKSLAKSLFWITEVKGFKLKVPIVTGLANLSLSQKTTKTRDKANTNWTDFLHWQIEI